MRAKPLRPVAWPKLPPCAPELRIGLLGGSFNPPHAAHRLIAIEALKRLGLDRVWWLASPGNPLKDRRDLAPLAERVAAARRVARHPRIHVTGIEAEIGALYTRDTIRWLASRAPNVRFVWLMGADNLVSFHRWQGWREIAASVPIAVFDRPGSGLSPLFSKFALAFAACRIPEADARRLAGMKPPAWVFLHQPRSALSSTRLRESVLKPQRIAP